MLATSFLILAAPVASAETRTLKLYYTHTREKAEITFKRNGRYIQSGLNDLNRFLRDWRRNEPTKMDPRLFDVVWETYRAVGARDYIHVVSAYRSPATNSMLRKRSKGVAEKSQHTLGKAMDFYIPGVKLSQLRAAALRIHGGGVGYYPRSGSPFVHLDVGSVRHWPRMKRNELMAVFPDGKTMHVPTDGKPLPGYQQALAAYEGRKRNGGTVQMASAAPRGNFLSRLFGGGADDVEDQGEISIVAAAAPEAMVGRSAQFAARTAQRQAPAAAAPAPVPPAPVAVRQDVQGPETILAALPERVIPTPLSAPRPPVAIGQGEDVAAAPAPEAPGETEAALETVALAMDIPLPTSRPQFPPTVAVAALPSAKSEGLIAALEADRRRPGSGGLAIADLLATAGGEANEALAAAPLPASRPQWQQQAAGFAPSDDMNGSASPRVALLEGGTDKDPVAILGTGVRTTAKAARPVAGDQKPDRKPVVIPVREQIARWALQTGHVTRLRSAERPSLAHDTIRSAPSTVYTIGFEQTGHTNPNRFRGKAVTFLAVAKFASN